MIGLPASLWFLIRAQRRAMWRRLLRGARTPRGAAFFIVGALAFTLWLLPGVIEVLRHGRQNPGPIRDVLPVVVLGMCLMNVLGSWGERAVAFMPAEVDMLYAAPFTRRQLLAYKLLQSATAATLAATLFSLFILKFTTFWITGWLGCLLTMIFMQLISMAAALIGQSIGEHAYSRARRFGIAIVLALAGVTIWYLRKQYGIGNTSIDGGTIGAPGEPAPNVSAREWMVRFGATPIGHTVLAPVRVFANLITAPHLYPDALKWAAIALAMIGVLVFIVMWLDVHYLETAADAGTKLYARVQRARRGSALVGPAGANAKRWHAPPLPRLGGAGPIAWRQLTSALRQSKGVFVLVGIICVIGVIVLFTTDPARDLSGALVGGIVWMTLMLTNNLRFDFRGDVDLIDTLKALPVRPATVVVAQMIAPVFVLWACQTFLLAAAVTLGRVPASYLPIGSLLALPVDLMLLLMENLMFLIFPSRQQSTGVGDMQGYGRQVVNVLVKMFALAITAGIAAGAGAAVYFTSNRSIVAALSTAGVALLLEGIAIIPVLAVAYAKFDPSLDTPA